MQAFKIVILSLLSIVNAYCQCYEGVMDTREIFVLYENDSAYTLKYFTYFHGDYTPFEYMFTLSKNDSEVQLKETLRTIVRKDDHFYVKWNVGTVEYVIKLKRKNCKRLKITKIPKERILKNHYHD